MAYITPLSERILIFALFMQKKGYPSWFANLGLQLSWECASQGAQMALYTIGEVALLCDINPVTFTGLAASLRITETAANRRRASAVYDADIDRIREIKRLD